MANHFSSARRWFYVITSVIGGEHKHYVICQIVDEKQLHRILNSYDTECDGYDISWFIDSNCLYPVFQSADSNEPGYVIANDTDFDSLYVVFDRGDFSK